MGTLYDYLNWRGDLTFSDVPINDVDSLIFSLISYIDLRHVVPEDGSSVPLKAAANAFFAQNPDPKKIPMGIIVPKGIVTLFRAVKDTKRFRSVEAFHHVNLLDTKMQMQFSATSFQLDNGSIVVAFRGTDDSLIGWKENFNMSFLPVVPAQTHATDYLNDVAQRYPQKTIYVTGHSKGGNLAVYAAVHAEPAVKEQIARVWSNDGPGFGQGMLSDPNYLEMRPKIKTLVPQSSVVGMLLEHDENYVVVESRQAGLFQHDGLTWKVMGGSFVHLKDTSESSKKIDHTLNSWIRQMTPEQREEFVEALYQILSADNVTTLTELVATGKSRLLKKSPDMDPHVKKTIQKTLAALFETNKNHLLNELFHKV